MASYLTNNLNFFYCLLNGIAAVQSFAVAELIVNMLLPLWLAATFFSSTPVTFN